MVENFDFQYSYRRLQENIFHKNEGKYQPRSQGNVSAASRSPILTKDSVSEKALGSRLGKYVVAASHGCHKETVFMKNWLNWKTTPFFEQLLKKLNLYAISLLY